MPARVRTIVRVRAAATRSTLARTAARVREPALPTVPRLRRLPSRMCWRLAKSAQASNNLPRPIGPMNRVAKMFEQFKHPDEHVSYQDETAAYRDNSKENVGPSSVSLPVTRNRCAGDRSLRACLRGLYDRARGAGTGCGRIGGNRGAHRALTVWPSRFGAQVSPDCVHGEDSLFRVNRPTATALSRGPGFTSEWDSKAGLPTRQSEHRCYWGAVNISGSAYSTRSKRAVSPRTVPARRENSL